MQGRPNLATRCRYCVRSIRHAVVLTLLVTAMVCVGTAAAHGATAPAANGSCRSHVSFGLVQVTTTGCLKQVSANKWQTSDPIKLNYLPLPVLPGTTATLTGPTANAPGGALELNTSISTPHGAPIFAGALHLVFPVGAKGDEYQAAVFPLIPGESIMKLPVAAAISLRIGWDKNGNHYALLRTLIDIPTPFRLSPTDQSQLLTALLDIRFDAHGTNLNGLKVDVKAAFLGHVGINDLCLSYVPPGAHQPIAPCAPPPYSSATPLAQCASNTDTTEGRWDGDFFLTLPTGNASPIGVFAGLRGGKFSYAGAQVTDLGSAVQLAPGVYLQEVGIAVCVRPGPLTITGGVGVGFGPPGMPNLAELDGTLTYVNARPWSVKVSGQLSLLQHPMANADMTFYSDGSVDFGFHAAYKAFLFSASADVNGWLKPSPKSVQFNTEGKGQICLAFIACADGEVVVSSVGIAGCIGVGTTTSTVMVKDEGWNPRNPALVHDQPESTLFRAGAGYKWGDSWPTLMGKSCDVGPYEASKATASSDGYKESFKVSNGRPLALLIRGATGAPNVVLKGPHNQRFSMPTKRAAITRDRSVFVADSVHRETYALIVHPKAGRWTVIVKPGSSRIVSVAQANTAQPPQAIAGVYRQGGKQYLGYAYQGSGRLQFVATNRRHTYSRVLGVTKRTVCPTSKPTSSPVYCGRIALGAGVKAAGQVKNALGVQQITVQSLGSNALSNPPVVVVASYKV